MPINEDSPILDEEWLYRRVHASMVDPDGSPLSPKSFEPRTKGRDIDTDGISLYRECCLVSSDQLIASIPPDKRHLHGIVKIRVIEVKSAGMTVVPNKAQIPGHVLIPEINARKYSKSNTEMIKGMNTLAGFATPLERRVKFWRKSEV